MINVEVVAQKSSYKGQLYPLTCRVTFNLPSQMFQMTLLMKESNCAKLFRILSMGKSHGLDKSRRTGADDTCTCTVVTL